LGKRLSEIVGEDGFIDSLKNADKVGVIREMVEEAAKRGKIRSEDVDDVINRILKREQQGSTGIGNGVAIPHIKQYSGVSEMVVVVGRTRHDVDFGAVDGQPCRLFFLILTPKKQTEEHMRVLRRVAAIARDAELCTYLVKEKNIKQVMRVLDAACEV